MRYAAYDAVKFLLRFEWIVAKHEVTHREEPCRCNVLNLAANCYHSDKWRLTLSTIQLKLERFAIERSNLIHFELPLDDTLAVDHSTSCSALVSSEWQGTH